MKSQRIVAPLVGALVLALGARALAQAGSTEEVRPAAEGVVNVNTATEEQLAYLPGIGPSRARAIVQSRQQQPFRTVQDLLRVRGIGPATLRSLRPYLTVSGETTLRRSVAGASPRREH
jgi:competence ComEA-like helix-hairpin-helix protein